MRTPKEIFNDGGAASAPYNTALKVQVCGLGEIVNYKNSRAETVFNNGACWWDDDYERNIVWNSKANMLKVERVCYD